MSRSTAAAQERGLEGPVEAVASRILAAVEIHDVVSVIVLQRSLALPGAGVGLMIDEVDRPEGTL